jgi:quinol-cytochrome oxidoreductase complex cytochrome b subunit
LIAGDYGEQTECQGTRITRVRENVQCFGANAFEALREKSKAIMEKRSHDAFLDARIQMESPLACFIMGPFALIYLVLSRTAMPWLAQAAFDKITKGGAIVALLSIAIFIFIDMSFGRYESIAEVETRFDSKADRKLVNLYFVGGLSALAVILFAAHFIKLSLPSSP